MFWVAVDVRHLDVVLKLAGRGDSASAEPFKLNKSEVQGKLEIFRGLNNSYCLRCRRNAVLFKNSK